MEEIPENIEIDEELRQDSIEHEYCLIHGEYECECIEMSPERELQENIHIEDEIRRELIEIEYCLVHDECIEMNSVSEWNAYVKEKQDKRREKLHNLHMKKYELDVAKDNLNRSAIRYMIEGLNNFLVAGNVPSLRVATTVAYEYAVESIIEANENLMEEEMLYGMWFKYTFFNV